MGNICRSPTAQGVLRQLTIDRGVEDLFEIDSAGTGDWHIGSAPDRRAQQAARARHIDLSTLRARQVRVEDFSRFDTIIAMDCRNMTQLQNLAPESLHHKIHLLLEYTAESAGREVPDPYYGGDNGFDAVLDLIEHGCENLLNQLMRR